jgi:hypothetical protein
MRREGRGLGVGRVAVTGSNNNLTYESIYRFIYNLTYELIIYSLPSNPVKGK